MPFINPSIKTTPVAGKLQDSAIQRPSYSKMQRGLERKIKLDHAITTFTKAEFKKFKKEELKELKQQIQESKQKLTVLKENQSKFQKGTLKAKSIASQIEIQQREFSDLHEEKAIVKTSHRTKDDTRKKITGITIRSNISKLAESYKNTSSLPTDLSWCPNDEIKTEFQVSLARNYKTTVLPGPAKDLNTNAPIYNPELAGIMKYILHATEDPTKTLEVADRLIGNLVLCPSDSKDRELEKIAEIFLEGNYFFPTELEDNKYLQFEVMEKMLDGCDRTSSDFPTEKFLERLADLCVEVRKVPENRPLGIPCPPSHEKLQEMVINRCLGSENCFKKEFSEDGTGVVLGVGIQEDGKEGEILYVLKPTRYEVDPNKPGAKNEEDLKNHPDGEGGKVSYLVTSGPLYPIPTSLKRFDISAWGDDNKPYSDKEECFVMPFIKNEGTIQDFHQVESFKESVQNKLDGIGNQLIQMEKSKVRLETELEEAENNIEYNKTDEGKKRIEELKQHIIILNKEITAQDKQVKKDKAAFTNDVQKMEKKLEYRNKHAERMGFENKDSSLESHKIWKHCNGPSVRLALYTTGFYVDRDFNWGNLAIPKLPQSSKNNPVYENVKFIHWDVDRALPRKFLPEQNIFTDQLACLDTDPVLQDFTKEEIELLLADNTSVEAELERIKQKSEEIGLKLPEECLQHMEARALLCRAGLEGGLTAQDIYDLQLAGHPKDNTKSLVSSLYKVIPDREQYKKALGLVVEAYNDAKKGTDLFATENRAMAKEEIITRFNENLSLHFNF